MISGRAIKRGNWWHIGWNEGGRWMQKSTHIRAEGNNPPPEVNRLLADIQEKLKCFKTGEEVLGFYKPFDSAPRAGTLS